MSNLSLFDKQQAIDSRKKEMRIKQRELKLSQLALQLEKTACSLQDRRIAYEKAKERHENAVRLYDIKKREIDPDIELLEYEEHKRHVRTLKERVDVLEQHILIDDDVDKSPLNDADLDAYFYDDDADDYLVYDDEANLTDHTGRMNVFDKLDD